MLETIIIVAFLYGAFLTFYNFMNCTGNDDDFYWWGMVKKKDRR